MDWRGGGTARPLRASWCKLSIAEWTWVVVSQWCTRTPQTFCPSSEPTSDGARSWSHRDEDDVQPVDIDNLTFYLSDIIHVTTLMHCGCVRIWYQSINLISEISNSRAHRLDKLQWHPTESNLQWEDVQARRSGRLLQQRDQTRGQGKTEGGNEIK